MKESWWSADPSKPERGRKLRESFLNTFTLRTEAAIFPEQNEKESHATETEDMAFCQSREERRRTLNPPESYRLPSLDLTKYITRNGIVTDHYVRKESDYQILRDRSIINIADSQRNYSHYLDNLTKMTNEQFRRYTMLCDKKKKNFWGRRSLMDDAYESRKIYIDTLTSPPRVKQSQTKN